MAIAKMVARYEPSKTMRTVVIRRIKFELIPD